MMRPMTKNGTREGSKATRIVGLVWFFVYIQYVLGSVSLDVFTVWVDENVAL